MAIEIVYFDNSNAKGGFIGNFGVKISEWNDIEINGLSLLRTAAGKRFVLFPRKQKRKEDGSYEKDYDYLNLPRETYDRFGASCIKAIDDHAAQSVTQQGMAQEQESCDDIPF